LSLNPQPISPDSADRPPSGQRYWGSLTHFLKAFRGAWWRLKLPAKLLLLTTMFVMLAEILIFLPSLANFRIGWLNDRLQTAYMTMIATDAVPGNNVPPAMRSELLREALVRSIAIHRGGIHRLVMPPVSPVEIDAHFDVRETPNENWPQTFATWFRHIRDAVGVFRAPVDRNIRVTGLLGPRFDDTIEIVMPEAPLRKAMAKHATDIFWLSVLISLITAALVYFAIDRLLVKPISRLSSNMLKFGENPEDKNRIIVPSGRGDEIGTAEAELSQMQRQLSQALTEKNRLAELGLAVSKISHDLRNMLANAQLISDRLTSIPDPTVQQFAPKLIASLDRAINFCTDTLRFGRSEEAAPRRVVMRLKPIIEEVADGLGLPRDGGIGFSSDISEGMLIDADHEHLFRILSNLVRNAVQALEQHRAEGSNVAGLIQIKAKRDGRKVVIDVSDNGPGVPAMARAKLFKAFQGSTRKGGTGLGLVIAHELAKAHSGSLTLLDTSPGATFRVEIPDRPIGGA
jgi:signal transduction histidine kinase